MLYFVGADDDIFNNDDDRLLILDDSIERGTNAAAIDNILMNANTEDTILVVLLTGRIRVFR